MTSSQFKKALRALKNSGVTNDRAASLVIAMHFAGPMTIQAWTEAFIEAGFKSPGIGAEDEEGREQLMRGVDARLSAEGNLVIVFEPVFEPWRVPPREHTEETITDDEEG
jgi:hypothetical protein